MDTVFESNFITDIETLCLRLSNFIMHLYTRQRDMMSHRDSEVTLP